MSDNVPDLLGDLEASLAEAHDARESRDISRAEWAELGEED